MSGYSFVNHRITVIYLHIFLVATSTYKRDLSISVEDFEFGVIVGDPSETKKKPYSLLWKMLLFLSFDAKIVVACS